MILLFLFVHLQWNSFRQLRVAFPKEAFKNAVQVLRLVHVNYANIILQSNCASRMRLSSRIVEPLAWCNVLGLEVLVLQRKTNLTHN